MLGLGGAVGQLTGLARRDSRAAFWSKLAKRSQSNLYFALVFLPSERREAFRDVYRFLRAADDVADAPGPEDAALERLARFRRELAAVYGGHATHPAALRLAHAVRRYGLTRAHFETILGALEEDVAPRRFADLAELERWCEAMTGTLARLCLEVLEVRGEAAEAYARDVGVALQLANILRDVAEDAARGHVYLPEKEMRAAGCRAEDLLAGRSSPGYPEVAAALAERARSLVVRGRAGLDAEQRRGLLVPEIWADVYMALLDELEAEGWDVFARRPYLRRRRKLRIAIARWLEAERHPHLARLIAH